jgi:hypothetical protein
MAWMIIKSAGDDFSFVTMKVDGDIGHTYEYAQKMAREVTQAMLEYSANHGKRNIGCTCSSYVLENFGCKCGASK